MPLGEGAWICEVEVWQNGCTLVYCLRRGGIDRLGRLGHGGHISLSLSVRLSDGHGRLSGSLAGSGCSELPFVVALIIVSPE
jgi:hypothetical protein